MEERAPRQPGHRHSLRGAGQTRGFRRLRASLLAVSAAFLAVALAAGVHSAAAARSTAASTVPGAPAASPAAAGTSPTAAAEPAATAVDVGLDGKINGIIAANGGYEIGVALLGFADGTVHQYGVRDAFVAASTAKVLAAEAYYSLAESGEASLDDPLGDYTAGFQVKEMIQQSDNDSWSLIMDAVGHADLTEYAASMGVDDDPESNTLTPAEMARILAGLYSGDLLDAQDTAQLLAYMQDTNYESLIPAAVPAGITVFHKYGLLGGELHDASILEKDGSAYAFVVYTKGEDLASVPERTEIIHQLTAAVAGALF